MNDDYDDTLAAAPGDLLALTPSQAYVVVVRGTNVGESFPVTGPVMVVGRGAGADIRLNDEGISRFHCKIRQEGGGYLLEDLGSRNGTYCNGEPVLPTMRTLYEGDRLQIGTTFVLRFTFVESRNSTQMFPVQDSARDPITGVFSKHYFMDQLEKDVAESIAQNTSLSLVLIHIDRFAELDDDALTSASNTLAKHVRENIRPEDVLARISPGDFALILRNTSPGNTFMLTERIRKSAMVLELAVPMRLSLGVAAISELSIASSHDMLVAAGSALQQVRSQGGNRCSLCTPELIREPRNRANV